MNSKSTSKTVSSRISHIQQVKKKKYKLVTKGFTAYEKRIGQFQMMDGVYQAFKSGMHTSH